MTMPTIAASIIVTNEIDFIEPLLQRLSFCDHVCIADFGSTDGTVELIEKYGGPNWYVAQVHQWPDDFGAARQVAYEIIPDAVDWWFRFDADETPSLAFIAGVRDALEALPPEITAVRIRQTNYVGDEGHYAANLGGFETHPRIFRHNKTVDQWNLWTGNVHEFVQTMTIDGLKPFMPHEIATWNVPVFHRGWLSQQRREDREDQYAEMSGSGVTGRGDLTDRHYDVRLVPAEVKEWT
jgi:glycosyltransferase involved in cell wall biosynthesis